MAFLRLKAIPMKATPPTVNTIRSWPKISLSPCGLYLVLKQNMLQQQTDFLASICAGAILLLPHQQKALTPHCHFYASKSLKCRLWDHVFILSHSHPQLSTAPWCCSQFQQPSCTFPLTCISQVRWPQLLKHVCHCAHTEYTLPASRQKAARYRSYIWVFTGNTEVKAQVFLIHNSLSSSLQIEIFLGFQKCEELLD